MVLNTFKYFYSIVWWFFRKIEKKLDYYFIYLPINKIVSFFFRKQKESDKQTDIIENDNIDKFASSMVFFLSSAMFFCFFYDIIVGIFNIHNPLIIGYPFVVFILGLVIVYIISRNLFELTYVDRFNQNIPKNVLIALAVIILSGLFIYVSFYYIIIPSQILLM